MHLRDIPMIIGEAIKRGLIPREAICEPRESGYFHVSRRGNVCFSYRNEKYDPNLFFEIEEGDSYNSLREITIDKLTPPTGTEIMHCDTEDGTTIFFISQEYF